MKTWEVDVNGKKHIIECKISSVGLTNKLIVDGEEHIVKSRSWAMILIDYEFKIEDTIFNLVAFGRKPKLAVNGIFLDSNKPYKPISPIPNWINILVIINIFISSFLWGLIGALISIIISLIALYLTIKNKKNLVIILFAVYFILEIVLVLSIFSLLK